MRIALVLVAAVGFLVPTLAEANPLGAAMIIAEGEVESPRMARSGNNLFFVWAERSDTGWYGEVMFRRSMGEGFGAVVQLSDSDGYANRPTVLANDNEVYVAWREHREDDKSVFFRVSRDAGQTFGPIVQVSFPPVTGGFPVLAASGSRVYVAWDYVDDDEVGGVLLAVSKDNGRTFGPVVRLDDGRGFGDVRIAAHGNGVHLLWDDAKRNDDPSILFRSSQNHGQTFGPLQTLSSSQRDMPYSTAGDLAAHGNKVFTRWDHCESNFMETQEYCAIMFRKSVDGGATFQPATTIVDALVPRGGLLGDGRMAVSNRDIYVSWTQATTTDSSYDFPTDIFLRKSQDAGQTFGATLNLTDSPHTISAGAGFAVDGQQAHLLWLERTPESWDEVLLGRTIDRGSLGPVVTISDDPGGFFNLMLQAEKGHIDIAWMDFSPAGTRILYRHGTDEIR